MTTGSIKRSRAAGHVAWSELNTATMAKVSVQLTSLHSQSLVSRVV